MKQDSSFPRRQRICLKRDFDKTFVEGGKAADSNIVVYAAGNELGYSRLGMAVGKKHGNAVERNRIKRLIREAFRLNKGSMPESADIVVVPIKGLKVELSAIAKSLVKVAGCAMEKNV